MLIAMCASGQTKLTMTGKTYTNNEDTWLGVDIPRSQPTIFVFSNNSITSVNRSGYLLQAGDEAPKSTNNNLDGALITGNKLIWNGSDMSSITHGLFTGHNKNVVMKYNYLDNVPMGIVRKSGNNMSNTGGGVAYNIVKGGAVGMVIKGMSNVNVYNNTFYNDRTTSQTYRPLLHIYTNTDNGLYSVSHGTKIYNNIFYTKYQTLAITIADAESLNGLECDYNVYWCENGSPRFSVNGSVKTFAQWQAMGYDLHSVVVDPHFQDFENFVPSARLDYGKDLGTGWKDGLAVNAQWGSVDPALAAQDGKWQVGAVIHGSVSQPGTPPPADQPGTQPPADQPGTQPPAGQPSNPVPAAPANTGATIEDNAPSDIILTYNSNLSAVIPSDTCFTAVVNGSPAKINRITVRESRIIVSLSESLKNGDVITLSYSRPATNPLKGETGGVIDAFSGMKITNNIKSVSIDPAGPEKISVYPNPAKDYLFINIQNPEASVKRTIFIYDFSGKLCMKKELDTDASHKMPIDLRPGFYLLRIEKGSETSLVQKLIVIQ
jgi:hypothetical protein